MIASSKVKNKDDQLKFFCNSTIDRIDEEEGKEWYIMDSAWINSWLAFVKFDDKVSPGPGFPTLKLI